MGVADINLKCIINSLCDSEDRGLAWSFDEEIFELLSQICIYSQMHVSGLNLKRISNPSPAAIVTSLSSACVQARQLQ